MARLTSTDDLRRIIAEPRPATRSKILDALDEQSIDFLKRCPFALVGTTAADGTIEVSPKGDEPGFIRVEDPQDAADPRAGRQQPGLWPQQHPGDRQDRPDRAGAGDRRDAARVGHRRDLRRCRAGRLAELAGQARPAGDARAHRALLLPLRPLDRARQAVGSQGLAGARPHLVRQDHRAAHRRGRRPSPRRSTPVSKAPTRRGSGPTADRISAFSSGLRTCQEE